VVAVLVQKAVLPELGRQVAGMEQLAEPAMVVTLLLIQEVVVAVLVGVALIPQAAATAALALSSLKYLTT
jgi:hypothetical protein